MTHEYAPQLMRKIRLTIQPSSLIKVHAHVPFNLNHRSGFNSYGLNPLPLRSFQKTLMQ